LRLPGPRSYALRRRLSGQELPGARSGDVPSALPSTTHGPHGTPRRDRRSRALPLLRRGFLRDRRRLSHRRGRPCSIIPSSSPFVTCFARATFVWPTALTDSTPGENLASTRRWKRPMKIDAHQHFWKYDPTDYAWIDDSMAVLKEDYLPERLAPI